MWPLLFILRNHLLPPKSSPKTPVACDPSSLFLETIWSKLAQVVDIVPIRSVWALKQDLEEEDQVYLGDSDWDSGNNLSLIVYTCAYASPGYEF